MATYIKKNGLNKSSLLNCAAIFICSILLQDATAEELMPNNPSSESQQIASKVDKYLTELTKKNFAGSVLVSFKGDILLSKGYGKSDVEKNIANTPQAVFDMLSVSKQITAAAILKLEMQGKLSVTDSISKYLVNVPSDKLDITIHQLLTHSSGFERQFRAPLQTAVLVV